MKNYCEVMLKENDFEANCTCSIYSMDKCKFSTLRSDHTCIHLFGLGRCNSPNARHDLFANRAIFVDGKGKP